MSQEEDRLLETRHAKSGTDHDGSKAKRLATQFFMTSAPPGALHEVMESKFATWQPYRHYRF